MKKNDKDGNLYAVIIAGGQGERFWPASRRRRPKQLLSIGGGRTLIKQALDRLKGFIPYERTFVITTQQQSGLTARHLNFIKRSRIIAEPVGRNTAAAMGLMAVIVRRHDPEGIMVVLPADHKINNRRGFLTVLREASSMAGEKQVIVTIGIKPDRPATGYGYVEVKKNTSCSLSGAGLVRSYQVKRFVEKPNLARAKKFISSGRFFWNSGMFIMKARIILDQIHEYMPGLYKGLMKIEAGWAKPGRAELIKKIYAGLDKVSIDYGVMEKADNICLVEAVFDWDDAGAWDALNRLYKADKNGNIILEKAKLVDTQNCIVVSDGRNLVAGLGIKDLIIVSYNDAVLVCPRGKAQQVKDLVRKLSQDRTCSRYL